MRRSHSGRRSHSSSLPTNLSTCKSAVLEAAVTVPTRLSVSLSNFSASVSRAQASSTSASMAEASENCAFSCMKISSAFGSTPRMLSMLGEVMMATSSSRNMMRIRSVFAVETRPKLSSATRAVCRRRGTTL